MRQTFRVFRNPKGLPKNLFSFRQQRLDPLSSLGRCQGSADLFARIFYEIELPVLDFNMKENNARRHVQAKFAVTVSEADMRDLFLKYDKQTNPRGKLEHVMAMIIQTLSAKNVDEALSADGKARIVNEIRRQLNDMFVDDSSGVVHEVYLNLLIQ